MDVMQRQSAPVRSGSIALMAGGVLGVGLTVLLAVLPATVPEERYSYPVDVGGFTALQVCFFLHHLLLVWGLWAVWRSGAAGRGLLATVGGLGSVVAMVLLSVQELVSISVRDDLVTSAAADTVNSTYGIVSILNGIALIVLGVAVLRARRWTGWTRWLPLALGVYVFVPLTPAIFGPFLVGRAAIGLWLVLFGVLGLALARESQAVRT